MSMGHACVKTARADRGQVTNSRFSVEHCTSMEIGGVLFVYYFLGFVKFIKFVVN